MVNFQSTIIVSELLAMVRRKLVCKDVRDDAASAAHIHLIQENAAPEPIPQNPIAEIEHLAVNRRHEYYAHYSKILYKALDLCNYHSRQYAKWCPKQANT